MQSLLGGGLIFCDPGFHDLNGVPDGARWHYEHRIDSRLVGVLDGVVTDGIFVSGHSAPFGGPDFLREDPPVTDVLDLVDGALAALHAGGVREARIQARPPVYSGAEPLLEYVLLHLGFRVAHCDVNMHLDLQPMREGGDPLSSFKRKRPYVRAALAEPYELVDVTGGDELTTLIRILDANRAAHGRPLGLPASYLERAAQAFPGRVRMRLLHQEGRPVAGAVIYRVLDDVDLLVNWGDAEHDLKRSPMDLLAHLMTVESLRTGARLFDLGPASEKDGTPNIGLINFKRSVGAVPGTRKVFVKSLD